MAIKHIVVSGKVQGVGFRRFVQKRARQQAVVGWVRNLIDGRVEIYADGSEAALESFLAWVQKGPPGSIVDDVQLIPKAHLEQIESDDFIVVVDGERLYGQDRN